MRFCFFGFFVFSVILIVGVWVTEMVEYFKFLVDFKGGFYFNLGLGILFFFLVWVFGSDWNVGYIGFGLVF